jgi:hypothetical protein
MPYRVDKWIPPIPNPELVMLVRALPVWPKRRTHG